MDTLGSDRHGQEILARFTGSTPGERDVRDRLFRFYDWCAQNDDIGELVSLATTIARWEDELVCAILTGVTNARSESLNRIVKLEARLAYSFRNPANQRRRVRTACTRGRSRAACTAQEQITSGRWSLDRRAAGRRCACARRAGMPLRLVPSCALCRASQAAVRCAPGGPELAAAGTARLEGHPCNGSGFVMSPVADVFHESGPRRVSAAATADRISPSRTAVCGPADRGGTVIQVDAATGKVVRVRDVGSSAPTGSRVGAGSIWVPPPDFNTGSDQTVPVPGRWRAGAAGPRSTRGTLATRPRCVKRNGGCWTSGARRLEEWSSGADAAALGEEVERLRHEVARLRDLLPRHDIQPGEGHQQTA